MSSLDFSLVFLWVHLCNLDECLDLIVPGRASLAEIVQMILPLLPWPCVLLESLRRSDTRSSCLIENSGAVLHSCLGLCEKSFMSPKLSYRYSVAEIVSVT